MLLGYSVPALRPLISWPYYYHAWQTTDKSGREQLRAEAEALLDAADDSYRVRAAYVETEAHSDGDDIMITHISDGDNTACPQDDGLRLPVHRQIEPDGLRLPMLRQQQPGPDGHCLSLSDYVPERGGRVIVFATSADPLYPPRDIYRDMAAQLLADRLAEAAAEKLQADLHWQGIRPAVGYPSMPDAGINFLLDRIIGFHTVGITLTENGAMRPHASVSGLMLPATNARYFHLGPIADDQLRDYARRRGMSTEEVRKFLGS